LITDGEDLAGAGVKKAEEIAKSNKIPNQGNVTIYTVGVGTEAGGLIQVFNETGSQDALRDANGQPVVSHLDEKTLRAIAQATGGEYQALGAIGEGMDKVRVAVTLGTTKLAEGLVRTSGVDRFQIPLGVAIVLLVAESLTGTRRKIRKPQSA
jgi:Ca-activated chloride channel family protein